MANCSDREAILAKLAFLIARERKLSALDDVTEAVAKEIGFEVRPDELADAVANFTRKERSVNMSEAAKLMAKLKGEARLSKRLREQITRLENELSTGQFSSNPKKQLQQLSASIQVLKNRADQLQFDANARKTLQQLEAKVAQLRNGVIPDPKSPKVRELTNEQAQVMAKQQRLRAEIRVRTNQLSQGKFKKAFNQAMGFLAIPKTLNTIADLSAVLSQGSIVALSRPGLVVKAFRDMFKSFTEAGANRVMRNRHADPQYEMSVLSGLAEIDRINSVEDAFVSANLLQRVPILNTVVNVSERTYTEFLNTLRFELWKTMYNTLGNGTPNEAKVIALMVNDMTGRGSLGRFEQLSPALNAMFFSPRNIAGQFNTLMLRPLTRTGNTKRTRWAIAGQYARYAIGVSTMLGATAMAMQGFYGEDVELDPRSSDFGQFKIPGKEGTTRINVFGGVDKMAVALSRLVPARNILRAAGLDDEIVDSIPLDGRKSTRTGKVRNFKTFDDRAGAAVRFFQYKLQPGVSTVVNLFGGEQSEDAFGRPFTVLPQENTLDGFIGEDKPNAISTLTVPLSMRDIAEAFEQHGYGTAATITILSLLGARTNTYQ